MGSGIDMEYIAEWQRLEQVDRQIEACEYCGVEAEDLKCTQVHGGRLICFMCFKNEVNNMVKNFNKDVFETIERFIDTYDDEWYEFLCTDFEECDRCG